MEEDTGPLHEVLGACDIGQVALQASVFLFVSNGLLRSQ